MDTRDEPLIEAKVDLEKLGSRYGRALTALIEAHERAYWYVATRKEAHVLMDRYHARYFSHIELTHDIRREVLGLLRERRFGRFLRSLESAVKS